MSIFSRNLPTMGVHLLVKFHNDRPSSNFLVRGHNDDSPRGLSKTKVGLFGSPDDTVDPMMSIFSWNLPTIVLHLQTIVVHLQIKFHEVLAQNGISALKSKLSKTVWASPDETADPMMPNFSWDLPTMGLHLRVKFHDDRPSSKFLARGDKKVGKKGRIRIRIKKKI